MLKRYDILITRTTFSNMKELFFMQVLQGSHGVANPAISTVNTSSVSLLSRAQTHTVHVIIQIMIRRMREQASTSLSPMSAQADCDWWSDVNDI